MARRSSETYGRFAEYYDFIYHDLVNYEGDVDFLETVFRRRLRSMPQNILDLGCGTGNHALPLAKRGYRITGLDRSAAQLAIARRKAREAGLPIRFLRADMTSFDLGRSFDAAVCMFGAFGYLTRATDVLRCLGSLRRHLGPGSVFVFEFWHTPAVRPSPDWIHKKGPEYELIRLAKGRFDARRHFLSIDFLFLVFKGARILNRFSETHTIRTYTVPEMRRLLARGGFDLLAAYGGTNLKKSFRPPSPSTFRVMAVARPRGHS